MSSPIRALVVPLGLGAALAVGCGGRATAPDTDTDGGKPATHDVDSGAPDPTSDASCPTSYADLPQGLSGDTGACPATACSYFGQFSCFCNPGSGWECIASNCLCASGDAGCVNVACSSDADCPTGQHCAAGLGQTVCSMGCEGNTACPAGATCKMFAP
jgi:hypothetical protein